MDPSACQRIFRKTGPIKARVAVPKLQIHVRVFEDTECVEVTPNTGKDATDRICAGVFVKRVVEGMVRSQAMKPVGIYPKRVLPEIDDFIDL